MFLKLAYLPSKLRFSGKYLFYQISAGQLSADSSSTETLYCLNSRTFLANQKARNAIVGAENILSSNITQMDKNI